MKKFIYLFFIIVVGFTVHDVQKEIITLEWIEILGKEENDAYVFFENSDVLTSHSLPAYSRVYKIADSRHNAYLEVENPVFEEIQLPEHCSWANEIPDTLEVQCNGLQSREEKSTELSIVPLKREGGKIFRLKSFELKRIPRILKNANKSIDWKNSSVLSSGKWVKIGTFGKGIYKIPYSRLTEWGFTTPSEVGVFGSGATLLSENPGERAYDDLEQCAVWSNNNGGEECLFFYAPGFVEWSINDGGHFVHQLNDYATQGYFFLGEVGTAQKNIELLDEVNDPVTHNLSTFDERELHEDEINNLLHLGSGKQWFGDKFLRGIERSYSFTMLNPDVSSPAYITVNGAARSYISSSMGISANGASLGNVQFSKVNINDTYGLYASEKNKRFEFTANDGSLNVSCTYNTGNSSAEAWLDYIELFYRRNLMAGANEMFFRDIASAGENNVVEFTAGNATANSKVFIVSDVNNLKEVPAALNGSNLKVKCKADRIEEYVLFNTDGTFKEPTLIGDVENQDLHALSTPEFVIVSHQSFMNSANELADFHRQYDNMNVEVVDAEQVYNEFSSGSKSATGIRNFLKMLYDRGDLKYVLLFGDGSFDNKNIRPEISNFIPTFQSDESLHPIYSFVSDDYFAMMDPDESVYKGAIDLGIGRIPAKTPFEAQLVVDKIKSYYEPEALGDWRNVLCFIGDDGDGALHMRQSEELADSINKNYGEFITDKIYFDAYVKEVTPAGDRYPDVNLAINERVKDGVLILNYVGHANEKFLAHEQVLGLSDINSWSNKNQLPIFVTATCEFSRFDADDSSSGEAVLLNPNGGGIGLFSTTRVVYASANFKLSKAFYSYIFEQNEVGEHYRMGDVMRLAKTSLGHDTNKRNFSLLADPALRLSYPEQRVVTSSVSKQSTEQSDTIGTLDKITISGFVSDYFGDKMNGFNGEIIPTIYDKAVEMKTLGNGGERPIDFTVQQNIIYKGRASVNNGDFSFSFVVPKDISYQIGKGKIVYYADNGSIDAHGAYTDFYIGGEGSDIVDNKGPGIQLFMDSPDFSSGDKTGKNPTLLAYLSDENGINTVGTGIGHDITVVLNDDYSNVFVLNNYYQAEKDDYTRGSIQFPFYDLAVGKHTLKLKAWDVANNSSEAEIEFEVSGEFFINGISNYPNPVNDYTYFVLEHNQGDATLDVIFDIYDQSGRQVDRFQQEIGSSGGRTNPVRWDLGQSNISATAGIYIYRSIVQNSDGVIDSKSGKMIIVR